MNLYSREEKHLSAERFAQPGAEYRGTPFWAWNGELDQATLDEQIEAFHKMGMGGYHIHVRTGMSTPYLSEEFMTFVQNCIRKGQSLDMLTWLYDEDRWPSGTAGGRVTKDHPEFAAMNLLWTPRAYGEAGPVKDLGVFGSGRGGNREENGDLIGMFDVVLNEDGTLASYRRIGSAQEAEGTCWYAYAETAIPNPWFNNAPYLDVLNKEAAEYFIELTHERYKEKVGDQFGKAIPAIFTDEPGFAVKGTLDFASSKQDVFLSWSRGLEALYQKQYGESLIAHLPELFWELPDGAVSQTRYHFHDLLTEQFASAFADTLGEWCEKNGLMLGGHLLGEESLNRQTQVIGEAMRGYRAWKEMPGIDMLCDFHEYNTAKQAQSAKHQQGAKAMLSELYGVTSYNFDFRGFKLQGDWQAALGVTVRVPHLTWMTMKGEAKRDYPASIGYQSPWWDQFALVEDHFARLNTALTRGKPQVRIAIIHPIESYWLAWGPKEQTALVRSQMEAHFQELTETLLFGGLTFDFISEARLPQLCAKPGNPLQVGEMAYDTVIVPDLRTIRRTTLNALTAFRAEGGDVIFLDACPSLVDAVPSRDVQPLYAASRHAGYAQSQLMEALEEKRMLDLRRFDGQRTSTLLHQMREEGENRWLFICKGKNPVSKDVDSAEKVKIRIRGEWMPTIYDTLTGRIIPVSAEYESGWTVLWKVWHDEDSLLLWLEPGRREEMRSGGQADAAASEEDESIHEKQDTLKKQAESEIRIPVPLRSELVLNEPNAVLLDMAEWSLDGGPLQPREELLRIDNACRDALGLARRAKHVVQPYLLQEEKTEHTITLRFTLESEIEVPMPMLALEEPLETRLILNGQNVEPCVCGWYVDHAIQTVRLPALSSGLNILEVTVPIGRRTNLEWMYLLGDFGVRVQGSAAVITKRPVQIGYGSIGTQGYPFYTGNFTYRFTIHAGGRLKIAIPKYRAALLKVAIDGKEQGRIAFAPCQLITESLPEGEHLVEITAYGQRQNGFGQVHHEQNVYFYQSPDSWRSSGDLWLDEYQLFPLGILKAPQITPAENGSGSLD